MKLNKDALYVGVIIVLLGLCGQFWYSYQFRPSREIRIYYNHDIQANDQVIGEIQNADKFVYFAIYTFTRPDIKDALLGARYRGLKVEGITDRDQTANQEAQGKIIRELRAAGIPIAEQTHNGIMHAKVIVTDKGYVAGSYNWTAAATTTNDEILEVGHDPAIRHQYELAVKKIIDKYAQ